MGRHEDNPRIYVPPPLLTAAVLVAGLYIDGRFADVPETSPYARGAGVLLILAGALLIAAALGLFWKKGTRPEPWAPASAIVSSGLYAWTRNPMYLGMLTVYAGVALYLVSPSAGLLLVPLFLAVDRLIIPREEAYLTRRFGEAYAAYRRGTRRWL
jgi:protein-S-isoprenylcysteine O-methyltransferase Ste14